MIENDVVQAKLRFLNEYLEDLAEYRSATLSAYSASKKDQRFAVEVLDHLASQTAR